MPALYEKQTLLSIIVEKKRERNRCLFLADPHAIMNNKRINQVMHERRGRLGKIDAF